MATTQTYRAAQQAAMRELASRGWTASRPGLNTPHMTSPDGRTRLWFKAQAIYRSHAAPGRSGALAHSFHDARSLTGGVDLRGYDGASLATALERGNVPARVPEAVQRQRAAQQAAQARNPNFRSHTEQKREEARLRERRAMVSETRMRLEAPQPASAEERNARMADRLRASGQWEPEQPREREPAVSGPSRQVSLAFGSLAPGGEVARDASGPGEASSSDS